MTGFYERLKTAAENKGMSLSAVAESIGLNRSSATKWKNGGGMSNATLKDVAKLLNVEITWLKTGKESESTKENPNLIKVKNALIAAGYQVFDNPSDLIIASKFLGNTIKPDIVIRYGNETKYLKIISNNPFSKLINPDTKDFIFLKENEIKFCIERVNEKFDVNPSGLKIEEITSHYLTNISDTHQLDNNIEQINSTLVPVIDLVAAGDWTDVADPYPIGDAESWEQCPVPHGENTFAVRINGESMLPKFEHGEVIFCDPSVQPENKDYVIAKLTDENQATFKQLIVEGNQRMLKALNPSWPQQYIQINGNCHIVGKVIARLEKF